MSIPKAKSDKREDDSLTSAEDYKLRDAADNNGIVPDDALQKVNPAAAERATVDHDPHHVAKDSEQYNSSVTQQKD